MRQALMLCAIVAAAAVATAVALGADNPSGFTTPHGAMLTGVATGSTVRPIITVGDTIPSGIDSKR